MIVEHYDQETETVQILESDDKMYLIKQKVDAAKLRSAKAKRQRKAEHGRIESRANQQPK